MEIWKDIDGYDGLYQVSDLGRVKSFVIDRTLGRIRKPCKSNCGYLRLAFNKDNKSKNQLVHRLVALAFLVNSENKKEVNHKDGIKTNNRLDNLEWVSSEENKKHAISIGLINGKGSRNKIAKLTEQQVLSIRMLYKLNNITQQKIAELFGVKQVAISNIIRRATWTHI